MKRTLALIAAVMLLAGCSGGSKAGTSPSATTTSPTTSATPAPATSTTTTPTPFTVLGSIVLTSASIFGAEEMGSPCAGSSGMSDIRAGAAVTVTDETGKVVGLGELSSGKTTQVRIECTFDFIVYKVPPGHGFYGVEVSHRGVVRFAEAKLREPIGLSLG
jgi:hypothetical protein